MDASPSQRRGLVIATMVGGAAAYLGLAALGWGSVAGLVGHPARAGFVALTLLFTALGLVSPVNLSSGVREDVRGRWIFLPSAAGMLVLFWLVPFLDRQDLWVVDGDAARFAGLALFALGCALRTWPVFVLGRRFSGLVAIQPEHELVTHGPYRWIRHPSYLGMMLALAGWALVFRSALGLAATAFGLVLLAARIEEEEALLASQFGERYAEYRRRTWRLVPGIY